MRITLSEILIICNHFAGATIIARIHSETAMRFALTMKLVILCATIAMATGVSAQQFPTRPVTVIVPYPAGGPTDTIGRILTERMAKALGQPVIVENVGGGAGSIGVGRVAKATPN